MFTSDSPLPCQINSALFQETSNLEDVAPNRMEAAEKHRLAAMRKDCAQLCGECPLQQKCLTQAVVGPEVHGFVAGTTGADRHKLRQVLGWNPDYSDLTRQECDNTSGVKFSPDDIDTVVDANPTWSTQQIASAVGCSTHTVRRHMKRRNQGWKAAPVPSTTEVVSALSLLS